MAKPFYCALALVALSGCPSPQCPDGSAMVEGRCADSDTGTSDIDASVRADANTDAFSIFDAWAPDAPPDAYVIPDAGSDGGICSRCPVGTPACLDGTSCVQCTAADTRACTGATPACDGTTNTCVACVDDSTCSGATPACNTTTHTCVACSATNDSACRASLTTPVCDAARNVCVGCLNSTTCSSMGATPVCNTTSQTCAICTATERGACAGTQPDCDTGACTCNGASCTSVTASRCNMGTNACEACTVPADCAHLSATPQCRAGGTCVQCLNNTHCAANQACNTTTNTCVPIVLGGTPRCGTCLRDTQCGAGMLCVPMTYDDPNTPASDPVGVGFHCLQRQATVAGADCVNARPHRSPQTLMSIDGTTDTFCGLRLSTCEAQAAFDSVNCMTLDAVGNARCGLPMVGDGVCQMSSMTTNNCSVFCITNNDCVSGTTCNTGLSPGVCTF